MLSKSKYMVGLGCPRLLWCIFNSPEKVPPIDEGTQALFDQGHEVGNLAKNKFPLGVEVRFSREAVETTIELLKRKVPVFEGSFAYKNSYCKADILEPVGEEWDLIEVKQSTSVKDEHLLDVAFQRYCIEGSGLKIRKCQIMHINNKYIKKGGIDPLGFFNCVDVTDQVASLIGDVEVHIQEMLRVIGLKEMPTPELGVECADPGNCPVCCNRLPVDCVTELYHLGKKAFPLINQGILLIKDVDLRMLNEKQKIQRECLLDGNPHIEREKIRKFLDSFSYPLFLLDFETVAPAIPLFDGMGPFQQLSFQVSIHVIENGPCNNKAKETVKHIEYLAPDSNDPRPGLISTLRKIGSTGSLVAFNCSFEKARIKELAEAFPEETWLLGLNERMVDLLDIFRNFWFYHPGQHGSCSIKKVLPALTGQGYEGLEIGKGEQAAREFLEVTYKGNPHGKDIPKIKEALLKYCERDTEGMVDILQVLWGICGMKKHENF